MDSIRERLLRTEDEFLSAVAVGGPAMETFNDWWSTLREDVENAVTLLTLDEDTLSLAALVSIRLEHFASTFEDLFSATSSVEAGMKGELEDLFTQLDLEDVHAEEGPPDALRVGPEVARATSSNYCREVMSDQSLDTSCPSSPTPSSSSSAVPSLVFDWEGSESGDEKDVLTTPLLGKRPLDSHAVDFDAGGKRKCRRMSQSLALAVSGSEFEDAIYDSPQTAEEHIVVPRKVKSLPSRSTVATSTCSSPCQPIRLHKRRLYDADAERPAKRRRGISADPRKQTVSNPLPLGHHGLESQFLDIDCWPSMFTIAGPATFAPPDISGPLEFDYSGWSRQIIAEDVALSFATTVSDPSIDDLFEDKQTCFADLSDQANTYVIDISAIADEDILSADAIASNHSSSDVECPTSSIDNIAEAFALSPLDDVGLTSLAPIESTPPAPSVCNSGSAAQDDSHTLAPCTQPLYLDAAEYAETSGSCPPWLKTPPPSFEDATTADYPDRDPPRYAVLDRNPQTIHCSPPPPYHHSSKEKRGFKHGTTLDVNTLLASLVPDTKRGVTKSLHQHAQILQAGFSIAV